MFAVSVSMETFALFRATSGRRGKSVGVGKRGSGGRVQLRPGSMFPTMAAQAFGLDRARISCPGERRRETGLRRLMSDEDG